MQQPIDLTNSDADDKPKRSRPSSKSDETAIVISDDDAEDSIPQPTLKKRFGFDFRPVDKLMKKVEEEIKETQTSIRRINDELLKVRTMRQNGIAEVDRFVSDHKENKAMYEAYNRKLTKLKNDILNKAFGEYSPHAYDAKLEFMKTTFARELQKASEHRLFF